MQGVDRVMAKALPALSMRVVNVVDLMGLQSPVSHSHGKSDEQFDQLFTTDCPVVFLMATRG